MLCKWLSPDQTRPGSKSRTSPTSLSQLGLVHPLEKAFPSHNHFVKLANLHSWRSTSFRLVWSKFYSDSFLPQFCSVCWVLKPDIGSGSKIVHTYWDSVKFTQNIQKKFFLQILRQWRMIGLLKGNIEKNGNLRWYLPFIYLI